MLLWVDMCKIDSAGPMGVSGGASFGCLCDPLAVLQLSFAEFKPTVNIDPQRLKFYTRKQVSEQMSIAQHELVAWRRQG